MPAGPRARATHGGRCGCRARRRWPAGGGMLAEGVTLHPGITEALADEAARYGLRLPDAI